MTATPSRQKKPKDESKHKAILKAATRLFLKNGYSNTSMDAIAAAAKVTKQTVYGHFNSKESLFKSMLAILCEKHTPPKDLLEGDALSIEQKLYEIGSSFLNMITSNEGLNATRLVIAEVQRHPSLAQRYYEDGTQRMVAILVEFLNQQNKQKLLSIPDTISAASYFFSMLKGRYYVRMLLAVKPTPNDKEKIAHVHETVAIFMRLYGGKKAMHTKDVL